MFLYLNTVQNLIRKRLLSIPYLRKKSLLHASYFLDSQDDLSVKFQMDILALSKT